MCLFSECQVIKMPKSKEVISSSDSESGSDSEVSCLFINMLTKVYSICFNHLLGLNIKCEKSIVHCLNVSLLPFGLILCSQCLTLMSNFTLFQWRFIKYLVVVILENVDFCKEWICIGWSIYISCIFLYNLHYGMPCAAL